MQNKSIFISRQIDRQIIDFFWFFSQGHLSLHCHQYLKILFVLFFSTLHIGDISYLVFIFLLFQLKLIMGGFIVYISYDITPHLIVSKQRVKLSSTCSDRIKSTNPFQCTDEDCSITFIFSFIVNQWSMIRNN